MKLRWQWIVLQIFAFCAFMLGLSGTIAMRVHTWNLGRDPFFPFSLLLLAVMLAGGFIFVLGFTDGEAYCYYHYLPASNPNIGFHEYRNKVLIAYNGWVWEFYPKKKDPSLDGRVVKLANYYNVKKKFLRTDVISYT